MTTDARLIDGPPLRKVLENLDHMEAELSRIREAIEASMPIDQFFLLDSVQYVRRELERCRVTRDAFSKIRVIKDVRGSNDCSLVLAKRIAEAAIATLKANEPKEQA